MSTFNETIILSNSRDEGNARAGLIPQSQVRAVTVEACVGKRARFLVVNEETRAALGLELDGSIFSTMEDGTGNRYAMTEPVKFRWKNREMAMNALFIPEADEVLFGAFCMDALDVMADTVNECLKGRHGDIAVHRLK